MVYLINGIENIQIIPTITDVMNWQMKPWMKLRGKSRYLAPSLYE